MTGEFFLSGYFWLYNTAKWSISAEFNDQYVEVYINIISKYQKVYIKCLYVS